MADLYRALDRDPQYARAYVGLGWAHLQAWSLQWSQDPQTLQRAFELAQQAIARDDSMPHAHRLLSQVYLWKKQHERAIAEAERAVALGPNDADAYETLAEVLGWSGRAEEAIGVIEKAMRLNPQYPFFYLWTLGHAYYLTGRTQEAIDTLGKALERNDNWLPAHAVLAVMYSEMGREKEARAQGVKGGEAHPRGHTGECEAEPSLQGREGSAAFPYGVAQGGILMI